MRFPALSIAIAALLAAAGCNKASTNDSGSLPGGSATAGTAAGGPDTSVPLSQDKDKIDDIKVGSGPELKAGDEAWVTYTGTLRKDGSLFDSNTQSSKDPLHVTVGMGEVIKGWDEGLVGMRKGAERKLTIPSALGYGEKGSGAKIPPNADLVFDIKLLDLLKGADRAQIDATDISAKPGSGPSVKKGDTVEINYVGTLANGKEFDRTKAPLEFKVGNGDVVSGLDEGVLGMKAGGERKLRLPPSIGAKGGQNLSPNQIQYYDVILEKIHK